jgi:hypothetical protein
MAIELELNLSTNIKPTQALELLSTHIGGLTLTWNGKNSYYLLGPTIEIDVSEPSGSWQEIIRDGFQFIPTLSVRFRFKLNSPTDYDTNRHFMFQATTFLLEHAEDAVLLHNYEIIVLQKLGGKLTFNSDLQLWDEEWLRDRLTLPFDCRLLPSPLL